MTQKKIRTLLVVMPFHNIWSPNIGTSILQSILASSGYECDIYYANIEFAKLSEMDFSEITHSSYLLTNDMLFASLLDNNFSDEVFKDNDYLNKVKSFTNDFIKETAQKIVQKNYDLIGFSLIFQAVPALALAREIKKISAHPKIIMGGSNCEGEMGEALHQNFQWIDFLCQGEGENLILDVVKYLSGYEPPIDKIPGLIYRKDGNSIINKKKNGCLFNLNDMPLANYDNWKEQLSENGFDINSDNCILPLETSRGCWYGDKQQCVFCGLSGANLSFRIKDAEKAIEELSFYQKSYGINNFFTTDLIFPNEYFDTFIPKLSKENKTHSIIYEIKASISKKELFKFKHAGINTIQPGLETLNSNLLKIMRKGTKAFQNIRVLKWAFEAGLTTVWNILYGLPNEKAEDYAEMTKLVPFLIHLQPPLFGIFPIVLQRFSPLYNESIKTNKEKIKPLADYYKIYNLPEDELSKLAYYFENPEHSDKKFDYVKPLKQQLKTWFDSARKSIFFSIKINDQLHFYDTRPVATAETISIEGRELEIYEACDKGTGFKALQELFDMDETVLKNILDRFVEKALVLFIDNKYLSLAVSMDDYIHPTLDAETNLTICASIYRTLMKKKCSSLKKVGERNLKEIGN